MVQSSLTKQQDALLPPASPRRTVPAVYIPRSPRNDKTRFFPKPESPRPVQKDSTRPVQKEAVRATARATPAAAGLSLDHAPDIVFPPTIKRKPIVSKSMIWSRRLFIGGLFLSALAILLSVWLSIDRVEKDNFETAFHDHSHAFLQSVESNFRLKIASLDAFSADITSLSRSSASAWPGVTIPDSAPRGEKANSLSGSLGLLFCPLVGPFARSDWRDHVEANQGWLQESLKYANNYVEPDPITANIHDGKFVALGQGPFLPLWQTMPAIPDANVYNHDLLNTSDYSRALQKVLETDMAVFDGNVDATKEEPDKGLTLASLNYFLDQKEHLYYDAEEPFGIFYYPVRKDFSSESQIVGILMQLNAWKDIFHAAILPDENVRFVCVVDNNQGNSFTYLVDGSEVIFLGSEDHHSLDYSHMENRLDLISALNTDSETRSSLIHPELIQYSLRVYPTEDMEDSFSVDIVVVYCIAIVCFCLLTVLFFVYDQVWEHRHKANFKLATSSLATKAFPDSSQTASQTMAGPPPIVPDEDSIEIKKASASKKGVDSKKGGDSKRSIDSKRGSDSKWGIDSSSNSSNSNNSDSSSEEEENEDAISTVQGDLADLNRHLVLREPPKQRIRSLLRENAEYEESESSYFQQDSKPVAEFFPNCTVMLADIAGFSSWSSQREPSQVFTLLQTLFQEFDQAARERNVLKIETFGDRYLAVTGLPDAQENHAVIMSLFAVECRKRLCQVTRRLERTLGPSTADLQLRVGMHSGPVTAGMTSGERPRIQLFGDTVLTASRLETTCLPNHVQVSQATANLLIKADKTSWLTERDDQIKVEGKGLMKTFWVESVNIKQRRGSELDAGLALNISLKNDLRIQNKEKRMDSNMRNILKAQKSAIWGKSFDIENRDGTVVRSGNVGGAGYTSRLVDWNVELLSQLLKQLIAHRMSMSLVMEEDVSPVEKQKINIAEGETFLDEVTEIFSLPGFDEYAAVIRVDPDSITLDEEVQDQLRDFVRKIASMYRDNPFHNYQHACHVQMSMFKLLQRVVTPEEIDYGGNSKDVASNAHDYTYGITSDPLTQFAVVFCALVHDVDHTGVTNGQLIKENAHIASLYNNKSVAEQNSIDLAWSLLMGPDYNKLRECIYTTRAEFHRFRQLVVNVVLATDIFDKELSALRKNRWAKAFSTDEETPPEDRLVSDSVHRKATIVIEHLIQASDVAHTMQHWDTYRFWNECLFFEMYLSYESGRTESDPSEGWYKGELWFFDNYVIPLAKKLADCGVFGVSSDECLTYALENRALWEANGEQIVADMLQKAYFAKTENRSILSRRRKRSLELV